MEVSRGQASILHNVRVLGEFAVVLLIWGFTSIFVKIGLDYSPPIWLAFLRTSVGFVGALVLLPALRVKGELSPRQKIAALLLGIPGITMFFGLWMTGESVVPPGESSVFIHNFPLWTLLLSVPVLGDRP